MDTLNKIIDILEQKKISQKDLTDYIGVNKGTFTKWKAGHNTSFLKYISKIAEFLDESTDYLLGTEKIEGNIASVNQNVYMIPVFDSVSAGFGAYACNDVIDYIPLIIKNSNYADSTIGINVKGDSMYPKIEENDTVIVRKQTSVDSGSIAVILLDDEEGLVKKVIYGKTWIELHSINPMYPVKRFEGADVQRIRVVGLVVDIFKHI